MSLQITPQSYIKVPNAPLIYGLQLAEVYNAIRTGRWMTLAEIAKETKAPIQSVSARLRDLRKKEYGGHTVLRERTAKARLYIYKLVLED